MRSSIGKRLAFAFIALAIGPLLLVGVVLGWQSFVTEEEQALHLQHQMAERVSIQVGAFFARLENELRLVGKLRRLASQPRAQQQDTLSELLTHQNIFNELIMTDAQGNELIHLYRALITPPSLGSRAQSAEFTIPQTTGQAYYSPVYFEEASSEPLMTLSVPLDNVRTGDRDGVLIGVLRIKPIWEIVEKLDVSAGQSVYIVDAQNVVVAHSDPSVVLRGTSFEVPQENSIQAGLTGSQVVLAVETLHYGQAEFNVIAEQALAEALALGINTIVVTLIVLVCAGVLAVASGLWIARQITRPINKLVDLTGAVSKGVLVQTGLTRQDEIGTLARSFDVMAEELLQQREALKRWNAELEQQVVERTRDLQAAKLTAEEASVQKSRFLANMSHELRTPLNAINGFTELVLDEDLFGPLEQRRRERLERVLANGQHLLSIINDILDLSKIEAGQIELRLAPAPLKPMLESLMATGSGLIKGKDLQLVLECPPDLPDVLMDSQRIRQVLLNLISNAAKFTSQGSITVMAAPHAEGWLRISVRDTGIGIAPEHHGLVFEEFRQVDDAFTREYQGTGLGLPITKRLVEMHGGEMWLESAIGQGSTFAFTLPVATTAQELPAPQLSELDLNHESKLVVVVDDDRDSLELVREYLKDSGYVMHGISDSREAVEAIARLQPRLVLLDVQMPHLNGWQVLTQLRELPATASLPVIMHSITDRHTLGTSLGANDYLVKPASKETILTFVRRWASLPSTVMVVDDDRDARQFLQTLLEEHSYQVVEAQNGLECIERLGQERVALILLDLMMPKLDGFGVLEHIRSSANPVIRELPVIVVSAKDLSDEEERWLLDNSLRLLKKGDLSRQELMQLIAEAVKA